jgi:electron transfer flavoprotein beta subunit
VKILAILRMVPDPAAELQVDADTMAIDREWLDFQLNDFDDHALEEAILLKEAVGGEVIAVCLGEGAVRTLQMAGAKGADELVVLQAPEEGPISSRDIAHALADLARSRAVDLIVTGVQTSEDLFGQLAPYLGGLLQWPHLSGTSRVEAGSGDLAVTQERGGGIAATWRVALPAVLGVQTATRAPRYVSGSKLREATRMAIARLPIADSGFAAAGTMLSLDMVSQEGLATSLGSDPDDVAENLLRLLDTRERLSGAA